MTPSRIAAVACLSVLLCACGSGSSDTGAPPASQVVTISSGTVRTVALGSLTAVQLADAQRSFGADLLRAVCKDEGTGNVTVSPGSAALALGQLDAGARGEARAKIDAMLHLPAWSDGVLAAYRAQRAQLSALSQLQLSNHVYSSYASPPEQATLNDLATGFGSKLARLDFTKPAATDVINADVNNDTHGLIPKLFDDPLDKDTLTAITNAIHLKADWVTPFDEITATPFTTDAGKKVTVQMMSASELSAAHRSYQGWQSAELPYQGGQLTAFAILPPHGSTCADVTGAALTALTTGASSDQADVQMPQLDLAQKHDLLTPLSGLGLQLSGHYEGFGPRVDEIDAAVQKVVVKVDQKGTEAAAATGFGMTGSALRVQPQLLVLNRPYLLVIQDTKSGTPLFLARVADPTAR